jgi:sigma-B regulation protein RsbU (phosphoserine phosphatase)
MTDRIARYQALIEVARHMSSVMDLPALLRSILSNARDMMRAEACSIFLPSPDSDELVLHAAASSQDREFVSIRVPRGTGVAWLVFDSRQTLNIQDALTDPRVNRAAAKASGLVTRTLLSVPLLNGDHCLGVMQLVNALDRPHFDEADVEIAEAYASLLASTLVRLEAERSAVAAERAHQELELAREIQDSFLPPPVRALPTCRVRMGFFPAQEIGGDFYFVHPLDEHRTLCGLGDVSGKGVPAALTMARATAEIRGLSSQVGADLGAWVTQLNNILCQELKQGRFIGMTFLLADSTTGTLQVCTAGQNPPAHSNNSPWKPVPCTPHLPLGILDDFLYRAQTFPLRPGDYWLLFSDGITEARNTAELELTQAGFLEKAPVGLNPPDTFNALVKNWKDFVGAAPPHDDASLMLFVWRGPAPAPVFIGQCCLENLAPARAFIEEWARFSCFDDITAGQIVLACDEATTNIYRHAYGGHPGPLEIHATIQDDHLLIRLIDQGTPVDPSKIKGRELDDLRPGGLGTVLLQRVFDSVTYHPQATGTILELKKRIP